jgi:RNA polymerase sigma-70 factor (ECF subfamily)
MTDLDGLATRALEGDRLAWSHLLDALRPLVERYCRARVGSREGAIVSTDDLTQEVLLAVVTALPRYRSDSGSVIAFVYGIAAHKTADSLRVLARSRSVACLETSDTGGPVPGPEDSVLDATAKTPLREAICRLPDSQREVLVLRIVLGFSVEETAEAVRRSPGAVRVAQHRALVSLREQLSTLPPSEGVA